ncbi:MAG: phosphoribosylanthranilate isomerase [Proteobacteria bacterium]|nr:phosphoribosylanthranilate isomerase [Pseudomonadota bacterium]
MKVKLCGFTESKSVAAAIANRADFIGFVFCSKSIRYIDPEKVTEIAKMIPPTINKVAVFANTDLEVIKKAYKNLAPQYFQFHGSETPKFLQKIREIFPKVKIIKAFKINTRQDLKEVRAFESVSDMFLFDSKPKSAQDAAGGSGQAFDWKILFGFRNRREWFLSGGIDINNALAAAKITGAHFIDVSSGIEKTRGEKSVELIEQLMKKVKGHVA